MQFKLQKEKGSIVEMTVLQQLGADEGGGGGEDARMGRGSSGFGLGRSRKVLWPYIYVYGYRTHYVVVSSWKSHDKPVCFIRGDPMAAHDTGGKLI